MQNTVSHVESQNRERRETKHQLQPEQFVMTNGYVITGTLLGIFRSGFL